MTRSRPMVPTGAAILLLLLGAGVVAWSMVGAGAGPTAAAAPNVALAAGMLRRIPNVVAGTPAKHADRGTCAHCHTVESAGGRGIPALFPSSPLAHEFRGVCSNCHQTSPVIPSRAAPTIRAGALTVHGHRGACVNCHFVVSAKGTQVSAITSGSPLTHEYRGNCVTCHGITVGWAPATPTNHGEWLGMEVAAITTAIADRFGLPPGAEGLVVVGAEPRAATAGVRAGDVVVGVGGAPVRTLADLYQCTANGTLASGRVDLVRQGQALAVILSL